MALLLAIRNMHFSVFRNRLITHKLGRFSKFSPKSGPHLCTSQTDKQCWIVQYGTAANYLTYIGQPLISWEPYDCLDSD